MKKIFLILFMLLALAIPAHAQLTQQGNETRIVGCTGSVCTLVTPNSPVNPNLLVNSGTNTFILGVNPTTNSLRLYITNDTANSCANLTISVASTGNNTLTSFNNNPAAWQSIQITTGATFASTAPITLPASGTVAITSQPIIGTTVAVFVVLSSGCATTNVDMQVVFGQFSPPVGAVQGVIPIGSNATTANPFVIAEQDQATNNVALPQTFTPISGGVRGLGIGGQDENPQTNATAVRWPGNVTDGPLGVHLYATSPNGSFTDPIYHAKNSLGACSGGSSGCEGIYVADSGYVAKGTNINIPVPSTFFNLWSFPNATSNIAYSAVETCRFDISSHNTGGTTPTLDVYIQDSWNGTLFNDRIHFNQILAADSTQAAGIAGSSANMNPTSYVSTTIAAGSVTSGPWGPFARATFVTGGTGPTYTLQLTVQCK